MAKAPKAAKVNPVEQNESAAIIGDTSNGSTAKKRGGNVKAFYIDDKGAEVSSMPDQCAGVVAKVGSEDGGKTFGSIGTKTVYLDNLSNITVKRLAGFGLRTLMQNSVNTAPDVHEGWEALDRRCGNLEKDVWADIGAGGGGVPLYLQAFRKAMEKVGQPEEVIAAKMAGFMEIYDDETGGEKEQEKRRKELRKTLLARPAIEAAMLELQAEAVAKRQAALAAKAPAGGAADDGLDGLL